MPDTQLVITNIGRISQIGWVAPANLSYDKWFKMAPGWGALHKGSKFGVGDWLNHGEKKYGETYAQAIDLTGINYDLLTNYSWVAQNVPISLRHENLSWWHHKLVAPYDYKQIAKILDKADRGEWPSRQLDRFIRRWRRWVEGPPPIPRSRRDETTGFTAMLPMYSSVKQEVESHYPSATPYQAADMTRFVLEKLRAYNDNGRVERAASEYNWKQIARRALHSRRGWRNIARSSEDRITQFTEENARMFDEIVELHKKLDDYENPLPDKRKWMENY